MLNYEQSEANELVKSMNKLLSGKGGGRADFAQCAGRWREDLAEVLLGLI